MSDIHIREKDPKNKTASCIFHFTVPATQNEVGVDWNEVIQKSKNPVPLMDDNDSTENASIAAGAIYEVREQVRFSTINLTNAQRIAEVEAEYTSRQSEIFSDLAGELDFFGKEIDI